MTPAMCLDFCSNFTFPYGFAGVEFGQECWCDGVIQLTANLTDSSACNMPCKGDVTLVCGGASHISIYTDGTPSPKIPTVATRRQPVLDAAQVALWQYAGCYSDSTADRTLGRLIANGMDANSCGAACEDTFPDSSESVVLSLAEEKTLLFSGVEFGGQCWCGTSIPSAARRLPDIACESMGCLGVNDQACGGDLVITVYQFNPLISIPCGGSRIAPFNTPFQINAVFVDEPTTSVPITMTSIIYHTNNGVTTTDAGTLSYCPTCPSPVTFVLDTDSQWELRAMVGPDTAINNHTVIHPAGTVNFIEITDDDKLFVGYCSTPSIIHPNLFELTAFRTHAPPPLAGPNRPIPSPFIPFALCSNLTAGGRLDVVFKTLTYQAGYNLTGCRDVVLELNYNVTTQN
ncbi:hypothetical protein B0H34DRAFT_859808 [Crassisporium funariophilum]|nr:hypothetical protein B0H34DRAFT_859808 [Crassisporium funariophilum]